MTPKHIRIERDCFLFYYWNIVDLQCCVSSWCRAKRFNYTYTHTHTYVFGFPDVSVVKNLPAKQKNVDLIPGSGRLPWRRKWQPTPVFLTGESPWAEEPGGLQSVGSQRARHDLETKAPPPHILFHFFPLWFITRYWIQFPLLYSKTLLFIHPTYTLASADPKLPIHPSPTTTFPLSSLASAKLFPTSVTLLLFHR